MRVSIIIPCYQQEIYLNRALESVDEQDYQDIEIIVVDDGSTSPVEIADEKYSFPVKLIRQENQGLSAARNTGIRHSSGLLIKFLDADDKLLPGCISAQVASFSSDTPAVNVIGYVEHDEDTHAETRIIPAFGDPLSALMMDNLAPIHSYMFVKSAVEGVGGFSTDSRVGHGCEDYDLIFRLAISGSIFYSSHQCGVVYFRRIGTMSKNRYGMQKSRADVWLHNIFFLLKYKTDVAFIRIVPILSGLIKISKWLTDEQLVLAVDIVMMSKYILAKQLCNIPKSELFCLLKLMSNLDLFNPVRKLLNSVLNEHVNPSIHINPTEINDYRLFLGGSQNKIEDCWVVKILTNARKYSGGIGIYGAGEYGVRIKNICAAAGYEIKCFFDKSASSIVTGDGIPIYHPNDIKNKSIDLVIIASVAFYDEIYESIKHNSCVVI